MDKTQPHFGQMHMRIVAGLLLIILLALGALWMIERRNTSTIERTWQATCEDQQKVIASLRLALARRPAIMVRRDELTTKEMTIDGRRREALLVPAALARRWGLGPDDVAVVAPATQPAD